MKVWQLVALIGLIWWLAPVHRFKIYSALIILVGLGLGPV